jgi:hypothetical protein
MQFRKGQISYISAHVSDPAAEYRWHAVPHSFWINEDDEVVHPYAPAGRGGPGVFRIAGSLAGDPFNNGLPHPWAPAVRQFDALTIWLLLAKDGEAP